MEKICDSYNYFNVINFLKNGEKLIWKIVRKNFKIKFKNLQELIRSLLIILNYYSDMDFIYIVSKFKFWPPKIFFIYFGFESF